MSRKRPKKKSTSQAKPSPPIDDEIDYTDFQFDEPQEFCVSICDGLKPAGDGSTTPNPDSVMKVETGEDALPCEEGQALPLSWLGLSHWTEALVLPKLDPQVTLVDIVKVRLLHSVRP